MINGSEDISSIPLETMLGIQNEKVSWSLDDYITFRKGVIWTKIQKEYSRSELVMLANSKPEIMELVMTFGFDSEGLHYSQ